MAHTRDLYKTKLCTLFQRGNCPRQSCSFAHGEAELRRLPGAGGFSGRQENHRGGDFRDRSDRHNSSPYRRHSPDRDGRGVRHGNLSGRRLSPRNRGRSRSRSLVRRRDSRSDTSLSERSKSKKHRGDGPDAHLSDVSVEDNDTNDGVDRVKSSAVSSSVSPRDELQEKLNEARQEITTLTDDKENLEKMLGTSVEETSMLTAKIEGLETKLSNSQEDYKRYTFKLKKMIKTYEKYHRAQEHVKKTQSKLQKLAEEFSRGEAYPLVTHADDSDYFNLSDTDLERPLNGIVTDGLSTLGLAVPKSTHVEDSVALARKRRLHAVREKTQALRNMQQNGGIIKTSQEKDLNFPGANQISRTGGAVATENSNKLGMFLFADVGSTKDLRPGSDTPSPPAEKAKIRDVRMSFPATASTAYSREIHADTLVEEEKVPVAGVAKERVTLNLNMPPGKMYQNESDFLGTGNLNQISKFRGGGQDIDADLGLQVKSGPQVGLSIKQSEI